VLDERTRKQLAANRAGFDALWAVYDPSYEAINDELMAIVEQLPELAALVGSMTPEQLAEQRRSSRDRFRTAIESGEWDDYFAHLKTEGVNYARGGMSFGTWMPLVLSLRHNLTDRLLEAYGKDDAKLRSSIAALTTWVDVAFATIAESYLHEKEKVIHEQHMAIRELATPILAVRPSLLILPLIGLIDSRRAADITESLLDAILEHRARAVVIDITGVPAVDSMVANHLIQTAEAARLMGTHVLVSGVSTANAQTLVRIGVDPTRLNTVGDLQSAIEHAQHFLGNGNAAASANGVEPAAPAEVEA
jgi:rsbT co-antagonist protein RsbR